MCITAANRPGALDGADAVEIAVEDDGEGMPPEVLEKAFEPFYTTKEVGRGTGLGLSQVYGFARAAGGTVEIASEPGKGTRVAMLLPRCTAQPAAEAAPVEHSAAVPLQGKRILLVEDDPSLNDLVSEMLEEHGSQVLRATNGAEALTLFERNAVDAALSDMVMPGEIDGLDLARKLREKRAGIPIVLMTGYSAAAAPAAAEGFAVLRKPFTLAALASCLAQSLDRVEFRTRLGQRGEQVVPPIRLGQQAVAGRETAGAVVETGGVNHLERGHQAPGLGRQLPAIERARRADVGDQDGEVPVPLQDRQRLLARAGGNDIVSGCGQVFLRQLAHEHLVFDQQDSGHRCSSSFSARRTDGALAVQKGQRNSRRP